MPMSNELGNKLDAPKPAKSYVPDWYKKATQFRGGEMKTERYGINKDLKLCVPFLDALTSGYCLELPVDVLVQRDEKGVVFFWNELDYLIVNRDHDMATTLPRPAGHDQGFFAWKLSIGFELPAGYSCLITHPFNRYDLPFITTSGVMESDNYTPAGEAPFFIRSGFTGVIPAGTPIVQIFPFKRENWESEYVPFDKSKTDKQRSLVNKYLYGGYKKHLWVKKTYN